MREKRLRYCNAGHTSPLLVRREEIRELSATGVPLAIMEDMQYTGGEEAFEPGDTLVIYSDGIPEAEVRRGQATGFYGEERLRKCALALVASGATASTLGAGLLEDVRRVAGEGMRVDDVTLVVVRRI